MNARTPLTSRLMTAAAVAWCALLLGAAHPAAAAWERFHGDPANSGFVDVVTAPAGKGSKSVPGLGTFALGAGPVIASDGTVYLGTLEGKVIALHADGSPFWSRAIGSAQRIVASPAIGADGTVYVVGVKQTDVHVAGTTKTLFESMLHRFTASGGALGQTPFPDHGGGGLALAAPNIVRAGGAEAVMLPTFYQNPVVPSITEVRLIAFAPTGALVADEKVATNNPGVTGGGGSVLGGFVMCLPPVGSALCLLGLTPQDYDPGVADGPPPPIRPGTAVFTFAGGGAPWVLVSDSFNDIVGYTFSGPGAFRETLRVHDAARRLASPPMTLPDGHTLVGTAGGEIVFAGPNGAKLGPVKGLGPVYAPPTRTAAGQVVVVAAKGLALLSGAKVLSRAALPTPSFVAAAASRTHVFVSTGDGLLSFDADAQLPLQTFPWVGGGASPPAIGPDGRVYAIASNILFVFPPPNGLVGKPLQPLPAAGQSVTTGGAKIKTITGVLQQPQQATAPQPGSQTFQPPLTKSGKRLYACKDLDGHGCGTPVAAAFCQQQGFTKAGKLDTQSQKVQAETLDGQTCNKKKCRVFELITCTR